MWWAEIKKAINSTLGTSNFKPLDKMISEFANYTKKVKALVRSDDEYYNVCMNTTLNPESEKGFFIARVPQTKGSFRIKMTCQSHSIEKKIVIYHGYEEGYMKKEEIIIPAYTPEMTYDVFFTEDTGISIHTNDKFSDCSFSICAKEVNLNGFEKFE